MENLKSILGNSSDLFAVVALLCCTAMFIAGMTLQTQGSSLLCWVAFIIAYPIMVRKGIL
jgi:type IV secretory pathway VirB2 component (pilin)